MSIGLVNYTEHEVAAAALKLGLPPAGLDERFTPAGGHALLRAAGVPVSEDGPATQRVQVGIERDGRVSVLAAYDRVGDGWRYPASGPLVDELYRYGARVGARLAAEGGVGGFAVDFVVDERVSAVRVIAREDDTTYAYATLLALRANAFRTGEVPGCDAAGLEWNPVARAGVVTYGSSVVALGNSLREAEALYEAVSAGSPAG